ncbi:multicopper oxidase family protein [Microbacterium sp. PRC9]|uniref:multicopper oxidase family protein n=1 Tax=Microbacterium sp. PRC9 TaxID=2962591 RepID=UPI00288291AF|nr:multicopper oxidase family protein [Microbacterium sp. PRC9]MDT0143913.1 multicopper oxidase family protein [Microbacterium sp. PRC9]
MLPPRTASAKSRWAWFARRLGAVLGLVAVGLVGWMWWASVLPGSYSALDMGVPDFGGGAGSEAHAAAHAHAGAADGTAAAPATGETSVPDLIVDPDRPADVHVELTARAERVSLDGGEPFDGFTLNGSTPGPTIRATEGQLVEVVLRNEDVPAGVTAHWHGVNVPNAMDGVAGVTQDAVMPGQSFTYRFVAEQVGTFWYHAHQASHPQVVGGLFGALILEPAPETDAATAAVTTAGVDLVAAIHTYPGGQRTIGGALGASHHDAAPGDIVRVRLVNTDSTPTSAWVTGSSFRVLAVDGHDLVGPTPVDDHSVQITAGGRADLELRVPDSGAARVQVPGVSVTIGPDGVDADETSPPREHLDLLSYGEPADVDFDPEAPERRFTYDIGRLPGFLDGRPGYWWTINGGMGAAVPMYMVDEGDVVVMTISNSSGEGHPMHLHGHHLLVLSRDGIPSSGSPWWVDSLDVAHGESFEVAFVADNPGVWMDHCHNLPHASEGLMTHVAYHGVTTPFRLGRDTGNDPE